MSAHDELLREDDSSVEDTISDCYRLTMEELDRNLAEKVATRSAVGRLMENADSLLAAADEVVETFRHYK